MTTIYSATLKPASFPGEYTCGEFVDFESDDWTDFISIGNLTEIEADKLTIHDRPSDARVFSLDGANFFIAYEEDTAS